MRRCFSAIRRSAINAAIVLTSLSIGLLLLEGGVRIFFSDQIVPKRLDLTETHYRRDSLLGHVPKPHLNAVPFDQPGSFQTVASTNSMGLRDREYSLQKPSGNTRIVALGDSFTWGWGVDRHEIYTERLEYRLADTEVINFGVSGYGLRQEIDYLKRDGLKFSPDVILVGFCLNDIDRAHSQHVSKQNRELGADDVLAKSNGRTGIFSHIKTWLADTSRLYDLIVSRINTDKRLVDFLVELGLKDRLGGFDDLDPNLSPALRTYPDKLRHSFQATKAELLELKSLADTLDIRLVIAVIPSVQSVIPLSFQHSIAYLDYAPEDFDLNRPYRLLKNFAVENDIELIAPVDRFRAAHRQNKSLFLKNDMHFSADGHAVFADALGDYLGNKQLVSGEAKR